MKATGIVRRIDDLGRVVIPKEIRRTLRIREGDPLEIFTENDGSVIFKKYSPIGELGEFAAWYAESMSKTLGMPACITDKDTVIAVSGISKKDVGDKRISSRIEDIMEGKSIYIASDSDSKVPIIDADTSYKAGIIAPIIFDGDSIGTVALLPDDKQKISEVETKLAENAAMFLGKTME